jgi:hypothetical protein
LTPKGEFIFERKGKCIYAFGLSGRGFKHMPYHGKRVMQLVEGDKKSADKYKEVENE